MNLVLSLHHPFPSVRPTYGRKRFYCSYFSLLLELVEAMERSVTQEITMLKYRVATTLEQAYRTSLFPPPSFACPTSFYYFLDSSLVVVESQVEAVPTQKLTEKLWKQRQGSRIHSKLPKSLTLKFRILEGSRIFGPPSKYAVHMATRLSLYIYMLSYPMGKDKIDTTYYASRRTTIFFLEQLVLIEKIISSRNFVGRRVAAAAG